MVMKNLKEMEFPVIDECEALKVMDILSITKGVYGAEVSDEPTDANDGLHIDILFDADMISEERIDKIILNLLNDSEELEEFYDRLAELDIHADLDELKRVGMYKGSMLD